MGTAEDGRAQRILDADRAALMRLLDPDAESWRQKTPEERDQVKVFAVSEACGTNPATGRLWHSPEEVAAETQRIRAAGCAPPRIGVSTIDRLCRVEIIPAMRLRAVLERKRARGYDWQVVTDALGGYGGSVSWVKAKAGWDVRLSGQGRRSMSMFADVEFAARFARALGCDPWEVGV